MSRQKLENELQLNTLRSKVIPHFTKNVLSAIGNFAMTNRVKASYYISIFSNFTQQTLSNADKNYINIVFNIEALLNGDCNGFISSYRIDLSNEEISNFKTYESMLSKCFLNNKQNIENFVEVYSKTNIKFKF